MNLFMGSIFIVQISVISVGKNGSLSEVNNDNCNGIFDLFFNWKDFFSIKSNVISLKSISIII